MKTHVFAAALTLATATSVGAVTVFDESIDGDAGNFAGAAVSLGTLDLNDVSTATGQVGPGNVGDTSDFYSFTSLVDFSINVVDFVVGVGDTFSNVRLYVDDGSFSPTDDLLFNASIGGPVSGLFGLQTAGSYLLRIGEFTPGSVTNYSFEVAAVPVPAGMALMVGALGGFAWMRRRKTA